MHQGRNHMLLSHVQHVKVASKAADLLDDLKELGRVVAHCQA